ncbi:MAG: VWA domain-containing protein [Flammeovirgaceae bacterium]|jgi:Ca-activated chloride channel homolog|nr:VWA domain-containing protein [Flammeovirgaceae bacterium]|tara:strand:- start:2281 stop:3324 length:1044 start_codon:yes stop_codon:yes gene_type:complete
MENNQSDWFSINWFTLERLESFEYQNQLWLYGLLLIPVILLIRWLLLKLNHQKLPIALTKQYIKNDPISLLRHLPPMIMACVIALLFIALARPQTTDEQVEQWSEGIDIMMVIDISESMQIQDFQPNRLEAAKEVARNFVKGRFQDRIGLVVFSGDAYSRSPLTTDYELLNTYIDGIDFSLIENRGTAIGSALAVGTNRLRESESASKVMILLSDGDNTAGNIDPLTAAKLASAYDITIYAIAIGKEGQVPFGQDFFGRTRYVENTLDETNLREIAKIGEGKFYRVSDQQALEAVFSEIDQLEKAEIKETRYKDTNDFYYIYLKWAIVLLLIWLFLKTTFVSNFMLD